jgi:hypothetical protein
MVKENMVHIYNGILFSHLKKKKNEILSFATTLNGTGDHYVK